MDNSIVACCSINAEAALCHSLPFCLNSSRKNLCVCLTCMQPAAHAATFQMRCCVGRAAHRMSCDGDHTLLWAKCGPYPTVMPTSRAKGRYWSCTNLSNPDGALLLLGLSPPALLEKAALLEEAAHPTCPASLPFLCSPRAVCLHACLLQGLLCWSSCDASWIGVLLMLQLACLLPCAACLKARQLALPAGIECACTG